MTRDDDCAVAADREQIERRRNSASLDEIADELAEALGVVVRRHPASVAQARRAAGARDIEIATRRPHIEPVSNLFEYVDLEEDGKLWIGFLLDGERWKKLGPFATEKARDAACDELAAGLRRDGAIDLLNPNPSHA